MQDTPAIIAKAENEILTDIIDYLTRLYSDTYIPSHDLSHHLRVWNYARQIILSLYGEEERAGEKFTRNLLLASMFHDSGMVNNMEADHGESGSVIFKSFISSYPHYNTDIDIVAEAIRLHDDKTYKEGTGDSRSVLSILSAADDMDAFGITGILRYWEIYRLRNIPEQDIPGMVIENASRRMETLRENYRDLTTIIDHTQKRYSLLVDFYSMLKYEQTGGIYHNAVSYAFSLINDNNLDMESAAARIISSEYSDSIAALISRGERLEDML